MDYEISRLKDDLRDKADHSHKSSEGGLLMGKVTVTFQSKQIQSQALLNAVRQLFPTPDIFRSALFDIYGFKPAEMEITIETGEEDNSEIVEE